MPGIHDVNALIAFGGGLVSFFSPCVLPLIPAYLGSLGAVTYPGQRNQAGRLKPVWLSLAFVAGFSAVFILMGLSLGMVGTFLVQHRLIFSRLGGVAILLFGLSQLGVIKLSFFQRSWAPGLNLSASKGAAKLFLMGVIFSLGWSPCVGPILAGILFLAIGAGNYQQAVFYLIAYSAGLALPFLLISIFVDSLLVKLHSVYGYWPWLGRLNGALLIVLGAILIGGRF